jgi:integrase
MRGHLKERSPGHWAIVLDVRDPATGKRKRKWFSFHGTKREAQVEAARLISEMQRGAYLEPSKTTLAEYLEKWLAHIQPRVSPRTMERYRELAIKNIAPLLGAVKLSKLQPIQISSAYAQALTGGRRDGKGGLSPRTVVHCHRLLRQALEQAVKWQILARNPAAAADPPKYERPLLATYDIEQMAQLLNAVRGSRMFVTVMLAGLCGLRRGEIAALRWRHVDLNAGQLSIVQSAEETKEGVRYKPPKSGKGRTVAIAGTVAAELRAHRVAQAEELLSIGVRLSDDALVVAQADGSPLLPGSITREWWALLARTGLPRIRFHDLRHAHATHLLASGVHPKIASERLGHSKVGITLDLYSHVLPGMQEEAAARVDAALQGALQKFRR